jgi:hypothetical protein
VLVHLGERTRPAARNRRPSGARFAGVAVSASVVADDTSRGRTDMGKIVISENVSLDGVFQRRADGTVTSMLIGVLGSLMRLDPVS